jgi:hypothetical protein
LTLLLKAGKENFELHGSRRYTMKAGDLVRILPRPFLGNRGTIGMLIKYPSDDLDDPIRLIPATVAVQGKITYVNKMYIKPLKRSTHVSKNKN